MFSTASDVALSQRLRKGRRSYPNALHVALQVLQTRASKIPTATVRVMCITVLTVSARSAESLHQM